MSKNPVTRLSGLAIVTGASSGIGLELAKRAAADGCDLILVARGDLSQAAADCRTIGAPSVATVSADLSTPDGIAAVMQAVAERPVAALFANAGAGKGGFWLDQRWEEIEHIIDTNVTGTLALVHAIGRRMRARNEGRILVTGSIVGDMPGAFNLTYNSTKSFLNDFCAGLAEELRDSRVAITCLLPGATDTPFFEEADMLDTVVGQAPKADPARVARDGYQALLKGETMIVSGLLNKLMFHAADLLPEELVAQMHRIMTRPQHTRKGAASA